MRRAKVAMGKGRGKAALVAVLAAVLTGALAETVLVGCAEVRSAVEQRQHAALAGKVRCEIDAADVTRFAFGDVELQVLDERVANGERGEWVGYLRTLVVLDGSLRIIAQYDGGALGLDALDDLAADAVDAAEPSATVSFGDVFHPAEGGPGYLVEVDGTLYRAVPAADAASAGVPLDVGALVARSANDSRGAFGIDPQDGTRIVRGGARYQVGDDVVPDEEAGAFVGIIADSVTFDAATHEPIADPAAIDLSGKNEAARSREHWTYGNVYELAGEDAQQTFLVEVNGLLHRADRI